MRLWNGISMERTSIAAELYPYSTGICTGRMSVLTVQILVLYNGIGTVLAIGRLYWYRSGPLPFRSIVPSKKNRRYLLCTTDITGISLQSAGTSFCSGESSQLRLRRHLRRRVRHRRGRRHLQTARYRLTSLVELL